MDVNLPAAARILVVDDEPDMLLLLEAHLRAAGYAVFTARDGLEGLQHAQSVLPDLILLDARLPGLDGMSACDLLRRLPSTAGIPVVIVTGYSGELPRDQAMAAGAVDFIDKPFQVEDLLRRIQNALAAARPPQEEDRDVLEEAADGSPLAPSAPE